MARGIDIKPKAQYHHGDLRGALIRATRQLLIERGAENFSLADACRVAGVSTAAPYKHFSDKDAILREIVKEGFDALSTRSIAACHQAGEGTLAGILALGEEYLRFARANTAVFRLMFGHNTAVKNVEDVTIRGQACFLQVNEQIGIYCRKNGIAGDAQLISLSLWTFVHGAASLDIDSDYEKVAPNLDVFALLHATAPRLLAQ
jgi:AcrR family transcriptional regulator